MGNRDEKQATQSSMHLEDFECPHYQDCAAPLCPKDVDLTERMWFPDEPVCRLKVVPDWIRAQKKIVRSKGIDAGKYFTLRMLNALDDVPKGMQGADPDLVTGERIWLTSYARSTGKQPAKRRSASKEEAGKDVGTYPLF